MTTSVALCTYNGVEFLAQQLNSIINQTKPVDEIIICDDGSTDATCSLVRQYIKESSIRIRLFQNTVNVGYIFNFEQAISLCSGDVIFLSDQDDEWMPHKVETICRFFEENESKEFVFTNAELINAWGVKSFDKTLFQAVGWNTFTRKIFDNGCPYDVLCTSGRITGATVALRSSFLPYCLPFPKMRTPSVHDEMIGISALLHNKIARIDECLIKYRLHEKQTVGINILLKYAPELWGLTKKTILWHETVSKRDRNIGMELLQFTYKRFWIRKQSFSFFRFIFMYVRGEYKKYYPCPLSVFMRDITSIFVRLADFINQIPYMRVLDTRYIY